MKITFKLPMAEELAAALCAMPDKDAGAAFKAVLVYMAGGHAKACWEECATGTFLTQVPALPVAAQGAFDSMKSMIDLSRKRADAGKSGSGMGGQATRFAPGKRKFAPSKPDFAPSKDVFAPSKLPAPNEVNILAGLEAFM
jgi:hypothetical protein